MAVAGPLVTLGLFALSVALGLLFSGGSNFGDAALIREGAKTTPALALVGWLAFINGALLVVQHHPRLPPRRRAHRAGDRVVAHRRPQPGHVAHRTHGPGVRRCCSACYGLVNLSTRNAFLWVLTLLLAFFLHQAAAQAVVQGELAKRIEHVTVGDIMDREPVTIPAQATLLDAQEQFFLRYRWPWFAVVDAGRAFPRRGARAAGLGRDRRRPPGAGGGGRAGARHARADRAPGAAGIAAGVRGDGPAREPWWRSTARVCCRASSRSPTFARHCGPPIRRAEEGPPAARGQPPYERAGPPSPRDRGGRGADGA